MIDPTRHPGRARRSGPSRCAGRRPALALLALACAALVAGCGLALPGLPDDGSVIGFAPGGRGDHPLLRGGDLGPEYRSNPAPGPTEDLTGAGCLAELAALGTGAGDRTAVTFTTDDPFDSLVVTHTVLGFDDPTGAAGALGLWEDRVTNCDRVELVQQGSTLRLDVVTDTERYGSGVTEEVNLLATGVVDSDSLDIAAGQWVSVARVQDHLSVVQVLDLDDGDAADEGRRLARLTADRLGSWIARHDPGPGDS